MVSQYTTMKPKRPPRTASRGSSPSGLILFFIGCACMFVLGVLVGRNTAPVNFDMENLDKKLNQLQASVLTDAEAAGDVLARETLEDIPFEFYDKLREETIGPADEPGGATPVKRPRFDKQTPSETAVALADIQETQDTAAKSPPVLTPSVKPEQKDASEPVAPAPAAEIQEETVDAAAVSGPGYAIQVASLRDPVKAATVRDKFRSKGYPAYTQVAVVEGKGQWCRVRLGPYPDKTRAQNDLSRLQKAGVDAILFLTDANNQ